ncbi:MULTISPECIES: peptidylprolyl isomerase [unclassified Enterococcus]|uniref:peptidylprolyl isomerase n=1 Tax=unclassified Enterococcus TaxID=2608891 RepID=UPI001CE06F49|nr:MULTISPECIES: peptidylprolyl isomerase [unclassified Enterococcus]MCA5012876.1 peptidylprolyl isomerase [Enterococcus sp. S23]MCA5016127.1 peptidylprolyl isomerase [Enterococcus sp. S22(2020)]
MKTKKFIAAATLLASLVFFTACGSKTENKADSSSSSETKTSESVDLNALELPQLSEKVSEDEDLVEMVTTDGTIEIKLFPKQAPKTVENFMTHAKDGYYDNVTFHRVIKDFMIQGGDPKGDGTGGESIWGDSFDDEFSNQLYNIRGALSMANAGTDADGNGTNGSQFFIVQNDQDVSDGLLKDDYPQKIIDAYKKGGTPFLDGKHTVFGQVTKGMDVVDKIASAETDESDKPKKDIRIEKINILQEAK